MINNVKKYILILIIASVLAIPASLFLIKRFSGPSSNGQVIDTVFLGPEEYKPTFDESMKSARGFYDLYGRARESSKAGDYDMAIKLLNESLPYVGIGLEKGMVYKKLAEVYHKQGNLEKELFYIEEWPKYSMNQQLNEEAKHRAAEIRSLLAAKNQADAK